MKKAMKDMDDQRAKDQVSNDTLTGMVTNINKLGDELTSSMKLSNLSYDFQALVSKKGVLDRELLMMKTQNDQILRENESLKRTANHLSVQLSEMKRRGPQLSSSSSSIDDKKSNKNKKW